MECTNTYYAAVGLIFKKSTPVFHFIFTWYCPAIFTIIYKTLHTTICFGVVVGILFHAACLYLRFDVSGSTNNTERSTQNTEESTQNTEGGVHTEYRGVLTEYRGVHTEYKGVHTQYIGVQTHNTEESRNNTQEPTNNTNNTEESTHNRIQRSPQTIQSPQTSPSFPTETLSTHSNLI